MGKIKNGDRVYWQEEGVLFSGRVDIPGEEVTLVKVFDYFTRLKMTNELYLDSQLKMNIEIE